MARTRWPLGGLLVLLALPAAGAWAADAVGTSAIRGQLRLLFKSWDLNNDGYLDRAELARAFRGPDAKPYLRPRGGPKPDFEKYPDYGFLVELDQNGDERISRKEFESWARDYAAEIKKQLHAENHPRPREAKPAAGAADKDLHHLQAEVRKEQGALRKAENHAKAYEKHVLHELQKLLKLEIKPAKP